MKYVFFGTPQFAAIVLEKLIEAGLVPEAVVCNPDEPTGRKKVLTAPPVKLLALKNNIKIYQPIKLSEIKTKLAGINADVFIVAAYNKIISEEIINIPKLKTIGVHPSLLPKYRGPSPIQTAILNGDKKTGVDLFLIDKEIDHGPVLAGTECDITEKDNYISLEKKLAELGAKLLIEDLPKYLSGKIKGIEQDHDKATFTKKFSTEDGFVELPPSVIARPSKAVAIPTKEIASSHTPRNDEVEKIFNKIRALNPDPGVFTFIKTIRRPAGGEKRVKLLDAELKDGKLELVRVQPEGKKPMSYKDFLNGLKNN
ncbi:MAG: methionyl-tRNA formyltransferase [Patescibacteria group bacterium]|nr:methionyl-tRNA formyltransferase [Patescibacteria group bacterium]